MTLDEYADCPLGRRSNRFDSHAQYARYAPMRHKACRRSRKVKSTCGARTRPGWVSRFCAPSSPMAISTTYRAIRRGPLAVTCDEPDSRRSAQLVGRRRRAASHSDGNITAPREVLIDLRKRLQSEAGWAAAARSAMTRSRWTTWKLERDLASLWRIGARSADVPYFLHGGTALGLGRA